MVDHSCDNATETKIREVVLKQQGVDGIDELKTRMFGAKMYVDIEILADGNLALYDAHGIAEAVHQTIETTFHNVNIVWYMLMRMNFSILHRTGKMI